MGGRQWKAKGNAALQAGKTSDAIEAYSKAIDLDGANHVFFSNRSAAFLKQGNASNALDDAKSCIGLNPDFSKGYSRKGAALHALRRYNDSIAAYEEGLAKFPGDRGLASGLESVKRDKDGPPRGAAGGMGGGANPMANLFGPQLIATMATDPKLRQYLNDDAFMTKLKIVQNDPNRLSDMLGDPRFMEVFQAALRAQGMDIRMGGDDEEDNKNAGGTTTTSNDAKPADKKGSEPEPMEAEEEEEDLSDLSPEERKKKEDAKKAMGAKKKGNALFMEKKFDEALAAYDEAIALDPTNMTYIANKAAVYFNTKKYDECIEACQKAVEVGKENRAPYEERAKALTRAAKAYQKKGDVDKAIQMCQEAQLEHFDKATERLLKTMQLEKKKADTLAYQDDDKAEEAKQRGNGHFRNKEWVKAIEEYEEAVKRAPNNAPIRNNLAAALCKIMDFNGAKTQIDKALELDPKYVKAWVRKGDLEVMVKEHHKALDSYKKGLELDPDNVACKEGLKKATYQINMANANMTEEEKKARAERAMSDPEIQAILNDPVINQVLKDFAENPNAAQKAMMDPIVRAKIEKLVAAGILQTG
jgi:stress-induced-phosphoprotein 1